MQRQSIEFQEEINYLRENDKKKLLIFAFFS